MAVRTRTDFIVIHCSATPPDMDIGAETIKGWHLKNGWSDIGYHYVIRRNGAVELGRSQNQVGAHVAGFNSVSVGVCMVGGLNKATGKGENNFTPAQFATLKNIVLELKADYPQAKILGHRDLSPDLNHDGKITSNEWIKECPSFEVSEWVHKEKLS